MNTEIDLSVVLPAYREAENLRVLLPRLKQAAEAFTHQYEILVIDTVTAMDETPEICSAAGARHVARRPTNSYGDAVRTGIRASRGELVVFMDADGSHSPEFLPRLFEHAEDHDLVIASRYVAGGRTENSWPLVLMSRVLNATYSLVLGIRCKDCSNSFRLYRGNLLRSLTLRCENFDVVEEILVQLATGRELRIQEVPFTFARRNAGRTKRNLLVFMATYLVTLGRLWLGKRRAASLCQTADSPSPLVTRPEEFQQA